MWAKAPQKQPDKTEKKETKKVRLRAAELDVTWIKSNVLIESS